MTASIYVTSTRAATGKTTIALGLVSVLERVLGRVAYFKPISKPAPPGTAPDVRLVREALGLPWEEAAMGVVTSDEVARAVAGGTWEDLIDRILEAYRALAASADFVVIEGTDYEGAMASFEFNINADLARNLGAPVVVVADAEHAFETTLTGKVRDPRAFETMLKNVRLVVESLQEKGCEHLGIIFNRTLPNAVGDLRFYAAAPLAERGIQVLGALPRTDDLERPTIAEIAAATGAEVISGGDRLEVPVQRVQVAAMGLDQVLARLGRGDLVLVPGDRSDVILGLSAATLTSAVPTPAGLVITGGIPVWDAVKRMVLDLTQRRLPVLALPWNSLEAALAVSAVKARLDPSQRTRIEVVKGLVEDHVDVGPILARAATRGLEERLTPRQFMHRVVDLAREDPRHVVLPEGCEERILRAAEAVRARGIARLTLLGNTAEIRRRIEALGLDLPDVALVDPATSPLREPYAREYQRLRAHKQPSLEHALDLMADPAYFGTMMVQLGEADALVSGSVTTTAATLRPALEFIKTRPGIHVASSVFFMLLPDTVLVYGDCAVNPNPSAEELAEIALSSAETARAFGITPRVAMLSYSTGASGHGSDVDKVRAATALVRQRAPNLPVEGPIQYDAAIDPGVARTKLPDSAVAGHATVFVFPDLNTGNNTYKAVQRAAHAIAVGPVMQGLNKPVNDLSRGCTVPDIINTIAITAVQAQGRKA
ncbi:MAG: phosphate acetyltransferase [Pseudomonadota bacterium]